MLRSSRRLVDVAGQNVHHAAWLWTAATGSFHTLSPLTLDDSGSKACRSNTLDGFLPSASILQPRDIRPVLGQTNTWRSCSTSFTSPEPRKRSMEFEDVMHKRRVFSKVILRLTTRYKTRIRKLDFKEGSEADNAQQELGEEYFKDVRDVVGRFRDDMDHVNAATVVHRMGCVAICYPDKSWMINAHKDIILDFANFLLQPEHLEILELRQAVMCYWGLSTFGPGLMDITLTQSSNETVADCLKKLEKHIRSCDVSLRNGNNVCNVVEAAAVAQVPLESETLEYLLTGAPGLLADPETSPQNIAGLLWGLSKLNLKDEWGAVPVAIDVVTSKHNKLRMDEVAKIVVALADMDITDYGRFLEETVNRVQVAVNYSERQMSAQNVVDFAKGLALLNFANHGPLMDYLVNDIKRRDVPLSYEQMEEFKKAADTLSYSLGSIDRDSVAEVA